MTYEKDPFKFEEIPDYALQPAKEADEYNFHYVPRGATGRFDPAAYEKVLHDSVKQAAEGEAEFFPPTMEENLPEVYADAEEVIAGPEAVLAEPEEVVAVPEAVLADAEEVVAVPPEEVFAEPEAVLAETEPISAAPEENTEAFETFAKPVSKPVFQPVFVPKTVPSKIIPFVGSTVSSKLKLVDMKKKEPARIMIEEDILVPDVKPDLARILAMDGKIRLLEREIHTGQMETDRIRISGDLMLQTLYVPENTVEGEPIVAIESRIPFKNETEMKVGPDSDIALAPGIESIDFSVVNERKFRIRATVVSG